MSLTDSRAADDYFARAYELRPELLAFTKLPKVERPVVTRARMAEFLQRRFAFTQQITREDLEQGGFTAAEIERHFHEAKRIARLPAMEV